MIHFNSDLHALPLHRDLFTYVYITEQSCLDAQGFVGTQVCVSSPVDAWPVRASTYPPTPTAPLDLHIFESVPASCVDVNMSQVSPDSGMRRASLSRILRFWLILVLPYPVPK